MKCLSDLERLVFVNNLLSGVSERKQSGFSKLSSIDNIYGIMLITKNKNKKCPGQSVQ